MQMLKVEWDKWWTTLPGLEAHESLSLYRVLFVADSGWQLDDRTDFVEEWQDRARTAQHWRTPESDQLEQRAKGGKDISGEIKRLFTRLREMWGPSTGGTDAGADGFQG